MAPEAQGGYDWGGGHSLQSSSELVRRTIEIAQAMAGERDHKKNIYKDFFLWFVRPGATERGLNIELMFPKYWNTVGFQPEVISQSPALQAIARKKITLLERGDCPRRADEPIADASVTKHSLDGEVCFSVGNLTKVAPSDLARQVMGLMVHEAVHLAGEDEAQAKIWQDNFSVYFGSRFGEMVGEAYLDDVGGKIYHTVVEWGTIEEMAGNKASIPLIYSRVGSMYGQLKTIQGIHDPIALQLRLSLKSSTTAYMFTHKLSSFMTAMDSNFYIENGPYHREVLDHDKLLVTIRQLRKTSSDMYELWKKLERAAHRIFKLRLRSHFKGF